MAIIDDAVADYISALNFAEDEFIKDVEEMQKQGFSTTEILAFLAAIDLATYFAQDLRMASAVGSTINATTTILDDLPFFGSITETQLVAFRNLQQSTLIKYTDYLGEIVRQEIVTGVQTGLSGPAIKDRIARSPLLSKSRIDNLVGTTMTNFQQSVIFAMAEELPTDTKYYYDGPLDNKTRNLCIELIANAPMTKQEIESRYPGCLSDRGGFNCRHVWVPVSPDVSYKREAQGQIQRKKDAGKYKKPLTLKQYYENRQGT